MDRYEFNLKTQQMRKLSADGRYEEAALIADEIDWSRVKNTRLLMLTADIYDATKQPEKEFDVLDIAYERSPMGKQLAYRLALVASELKEYDEAENYYKDYVDMAPNDSRRFLLRYRLLKARGEDLDLLIGLLERYLDGDIEERWSYELSELYAKAGYQDKCISLCDELITWFGDGKYVFAALKLKKKYAPLSVSQQQKYDAMKKDEGEKSADEDEEVGVEIARTRNEVLRSRTLPEKMQAVAEKRIQDDAGSEVPEKNAVPEAPKKSVDPENAENAEKIAEIEAPKKSAGSEMPKKKEEPAAPKNTETGAAAENKKDEASEVASAGKIDGTTRKYDGRAIRRAEARMQKADHSSDTFDLDKEDAPKNVGTQNAAEADRASVIKDVSKEKNAGEDGPEAEPDFNIDDIHIKTYSDRAYDTMNIQAELAKSMEAILRTDEAKNSQKATRKSGKHGSGPAVRTYAPPATEVAEGDPFGYEQDRKVPEKQITGQMSIEEILKDLQTRGILKEDTVESALRVTGQLPLWKAGEAERNPAEPAAKTAAQPAAAVSANTEQSSEEMEKAAQKEEAEAAVTEERVVQEMEEISLRDFTTGEIDLDIIQSEVDERQKEEQNHIGANLFDLEEPQAEPKLQSVSGIDFLQTEKSDPAPQKEEISEPQQRAEEELLKPEETVVAGTEFTDEIKWELPDDTEEESGEEKPETAETAEEEPEEAKWELPDDTEEESGEEKPETAETTDEATEEEPEEAKWELPDDTEEESGEEKPEAGETPDEAAEEEPEEAKWELPDDTEEVPEKADSEVRDEDEADFESTDDRRFDTDDFLSELKQDLSRLGQEGNPYTQMRNEDVKRETEKMADVFAVIREMETDLSEEDRIYNAYTEEEPKEKLFLDEADRKEFDQYLSITGMESQIAKAINDYVSAYGNDGTSKNPNILITGGAKTGKSQLAVSLIRAINRHLGREGRKTARISGFNLNRKTLSASMPRLLGNDLLIEHAGEINRKIVAELMDVLPKYTGGMIVVMEDEKARLDHLFEDYPLLADYFPNHLDIKEYDINEWAAVAKSYARSQGYTIDELGTLALYAEIDALYGMLQGLEVDDIKDIVDDAIEHSERKMGAAFARIFGKKKATGRKVLRETDFNA